MAAGIAVRVWSIEDLIAEIPVAPVGRTGRVPVSDFKARAADWLRRVSDTGQPVVITQNGKAAGVLMSPAQFDELTEQLRLVGAIDAGLADAEAGRVHSQAQVIAHMKHRAARRKNP
jgi:prevent-host-death family protein